ncbi:MAG: hypothetical protein EX272_16085 [Chromatiales bacterium]|nr:MAG: hypothetical protein EX272_16085 [Chromatiales bacterium]
MDKLAKQLREDAQRIDVTISDELDRRIDASLRAATPETETQRPVPVARPPLFWWASTITGIAAAIAVIALVNLQEPEQPTAPPVDLMATVPSIELKAETAMLTAPLQEELDRLQSDLKKAEEQVRRDIGL